MNKLVQAIALAVEAHGDQLDKAGMPYILHPLHVMDAVDSIDAKIVAVLHDVIEDTDARIEYDCIEDNGFFAIVSKGKSYFFDHYILEALDAISKRKGEKLEAYWTRIKANELALQVKLADIAHNRSERRLAALSEDERDYLRNKYDRAIRFLIGASNA